MRETIVQFGEGNFLRAFVDAFIDDLNRQGLYDGNIVIVKPRPGGSLETFRQQNSVYNLFLRGLENGQPVEKRQEVHSVSRCVHPYEDFNAYLALAENPALRFVVSNTTEAGIVYDAADRFTDRPAASFPGKLTQLLYARYQKGLPGLILLPCELIDSNGDNLKQCVLQYAVQWQLGEDFVNWLQTENRFCNTLVDRIVTGFPKEDYEDFKAKIGYDDRLLTTAEPFHLWVIEGDFENELPLQKGGVNVIWTDDVKPYKKQKVRILNGAHTSMVFPALLCGLETVGDCLNDGQMQQFIRICLSEVIVPVLGGGESFAAAVLERFANPFIRHQLRAIALNSVSKMAVRVLPTAVEYAEKYSVYPKPFALSLAALIAFYRTDKPSDNPDNTAFIRAHTTREIVENNALWQADIRGMASLVSKAETMIENEGIREAIQWAIS